MNSLAAKPSPNSQDRERDDGDGAAVSHFQIVQLARESAATLGRCRRRARVGIGLLQASAMASSRQLVENASRRRRHHHPARVLWFGLGFAAKLFIVILLAIFPC